MKTLTFRSTLNASFATLARAEAKKSRYALRYGHRLWREVWSLAREGKWPVAYALDVRAARFARGLLLDQGQAVEPAPPQKIAEPAMPWPSGTCALAPSPPFEVRKVHRQPRIPTPRPTRYVRSPSTDSIVFYTLFASGGSHETTIIPHGIDHRGNVTSTTIYRRDLYRSTTGSWPMPHCTIHNLHHVCDMTDLPKDEQRAKYKLAHTGRSALDKILG